MWTVENRGSYDRGGLRYPSDVTDDEWAHIAPLIPPAKRGGRKRNVDVRDVVNGLMYILSTAANGERSPRTCHHAARCSAILSFGTMTERWIASIIVYTSNVVKRSGARPVPRPVLSTLRV